MTQQAEATDIAELRERLNAESVLRKCFQMLAEQLLARALAAEANAKIPGTVEQCPMCSRVRSLGGFSDCPTIIKYCPIRAALKENARAE